jgi:hypothetical protein
VPPVGLPGGRGIPSFMPEWHLTSGLLAFVGLANKRRKAYDAIVDEGRKRVLLIAASILAARKLSQFDSGAKVPATICAIADAIRWAEQIMQEIDKRWPAKVDARPT